MTDYSSKSEFDVLGAGPVGTGRILPGEDVRAQVDTRADGVAISNTDHLASLRRLDELYRPDADAQPTLAWDYASRELTISAATLKLRSTYDDVENDASEPCTINLAAGVYNFPNTTQVVLIYDATFEPGDTLNLTTASIGSEIRTFVSSDAAISFLRGEAATGTRKTHFALMLFVVEAQDLVMLGRYRVPDGNTLENLRYLADRVASADLSGLTAVVNQDRNLIFLRGTDDLVVDAPAAGSVRVTSATAEDCLYLPNNTKIQLDWSAGPTVTAASPYLAISLGRGETPGTTITRAPFATDGVYNPAGTDTFLVIAARVPDSVPPAIRFITGATIPVGGRGSWLTAYDTDRVKARFGHFRAFINQSADLPSWDPSSDPGLQVTDTVNNDGVDPASNSAVIPILSDDGTWRSTGSGFLLFTLGVAEIFGETEMTFSSPTNPDETVDGVDFLTSNGGGGNFGGARMERLQADEIYLLNSGPGTYFKLAESFIDLGSRVTTLEFEMNAAEAAILVNEGDITSNANNIATNVADITTNELAITALEQSAAQFVADPADVPASGNALRYAFSKSLQPGDGQAAAVASPGADIAFNHVKSTGRRLYYALTDTSGPSSNLVSRSHDMTTAYQTGALSEILDVCPMFSRSTTIVAVTEDDPGGNLIKIYEDDGAALSLLDSEDPGIEAESMVFVQTDFDSGYMFVTTSANEVYYATVTVSVVGTVTWGSWITSAALSALFSSNIGKIAAVVHGSTGSGPNALSGAVGVWGLSAANQATFGVFELESIATPPAATFNWNATLSVGNADSNVPRLFCSDGRHFYAVLSNNTNTEGTLYKIAPRTWEGAGSNADRFDDTVVFAKKVPTGTVFRSIVATGREVILASDDSLFAWDSESGAPMWRYFFEDAETGTPARTVRSLAMDSLGILVSAESNGGAGDALRRHNDGFPGRWLADVGQSAGAPVGRFRADLIDTYAIPF